MILFSFSQYEYYASKLRRLPGWERGHFSMDRYQNQELFAQVKTSVKGKQCAILAETAPPDGNLLSLLLLAHTLKKEGAGKIIAIIPYLGYSRHDRGVPGLDLATQWLGGALKDAGISEVITIDAHSAFDTELFPIPLHSLSTATILAKAIRKHPFEGAVLVAPDKGAVDNCEAVRDALGKDLPIAFCEKKRVSGRVVRLTLRGAVAERAVMVDDMIDTGSTLLRCAAELRKAGAHATDVLVSHGIFSGTEWKQLWSHGVEHIYCTDTIPLTRKIVSKKITVLSASSILVEHFKKTAYER